MTDKRKYRILVIEDDPATQKVLSAIINSHPQLKVTDIASNPYEAREIIKKSPPDAVTLDIELPEMNGIEFLQKLMEHHPLPVIVLSAFTAKGSDIACQALVSGALEVIEKRGTTKTLAAQKDLITSLIFEAAGSKRAEKIRLQSAISKYPAPYTEFPKDALLLIGLSIGGPELLQSLIPNLPENLPPTCITLHIPDYFGTHLVDSLNRKSPLDIQFASDNEVINSGSIRLAPPNQHLSLIKKNNQFITKLDQSEKVSGHRPSVDVLFQSATNFANENTLAAVLTGMGSDGAKGLLTLKEKGAQTVIESKETATIYGMPLASKKLGAAQHEIPIYELPQVIAQCLGKQHVLTP